MLTTLVIARLKEQVPALRTVGGALDLAALMKGNALAQHTPAAHVVPRGERGGAVVDATGGYIQAVSETLAVVLTFRHTDAARTTGADPVDDICAAVRATIAGWQPAGYPNVFRLSQGASLAAPPGSYAYAVEFTLDHQLRIIA